MSLPRAGRLSAVIVITLSPVLPFHLEPQQLNSNALVKSVPRRHAGRSDLHQEADLRYVLSVVRSGSKADPVLCASSNAQRRTGLAGV